MRGINKVILIGILGRDPETKTFPNGGSLTQFSIATSDSWTDKNTGEKKEQTEWHRIVLHNRLGEIAQQYLRKGSKVYIEGSLRTRQWTDQSGQERYTTEIRGEQMQMLDSGNNQNNNQNNNQGGNFGGQPQGGGYGGQQGGGYGGQPQGGGYGGQPQGGGYGNQGQGGKAAPSNKPNNNQQSIDPSLDEDLPF